MSDSFYNKIEVEQGQEPRTAHNLAVANNQRDKNNMRILILMKKLLLS